MQDYDEALSSGGKENNYKYSINRRKKIVKRNGSRRRKHLAKLRGGRKEYGESWGTGESGGWEGQLCKGWAFLSIIRFGKLDKSRAIDGCTPYPFLR